METEETENNPRTVRSNWLIYSWNQISRANKVILILSLLLVILQVSATITVLIIGHSNKIQPPPHCEEPLEIYLIIYVIRVGLSFPLIIYQHLSQRHRNEDDSNFMMSGWAYRLKSLLDLFSILWFIVGNYLIFSPSNCSTDASLFYYTILAFVILGYALLLIPIVICISAIFCLPFVLVAMRSFNINVSAFMEGGTKEDLGKIPVFKYKAPTNEDIERCDQGTSAQPQLENTESRTKPERKANFIKRWMKRHTTTMAEKEEEQQEIEYLTISRSENALCSICLCEYENEDLICKLWQVFSDQSLQIKTYKFGAGATTSITGTALKNG
ncbi:hypothetical protein G6F57_011090 [Rhizopus arrhizus]|uniref:Uncharacterized protein n=1 Tax=Rhizopus oryzae TaxID=64495 RepID=A0A9P6XE67_RHIOR|nr:hypothetical protein G6F23_007911 [Rhizopus arrhizus]KAG1410279.1 hypothetical protein G6F58_009237 [Rhizopus delemar]KAG0765367.1 hypothetical protein G6F24_004475 [Rhizopus arrhizus]KAG0782659.1 hypothetical protein G6F21_010991 [Rhizopus arrhizus]KAG0791382.1 hypothetical protein G6F22_006153 [Rhizopus arrhizus]